MISLIRARPDIYLVGLGTYELRQVTVETMEVLQTATMICHFTQKHHLLAELNENVVDLNALYDVPGARTDPYRMIALRVADLAERHKPVAVAFDGNPMIYCDASWQIVAVAAARGLQVEALAAVSCLDVFPAQLGFEFADVGLQVFEANQLVMYELAMNPFLSTLILQVGYFNEVSTKEPPVRAPGSYTQLVEHLAKFFARDHPLVFIRSAYSRVCGTTIFSTQLDRLDEFRDVINGGTSLYIPRSAVPPVINQIRPDLPTLTVEDGDE